jgi:hypothetical protein
MMERNLTALTISVDLPSDPGHTAPGSRASLTVGELVDVFTEYRVAASWSMAHPATSPWTFQIRRAAPVHEIGLQVDASWDQGDRTRFASELTRRVDHCVASGLAVSSISFRGCKPLEAWDILVRHRLPLVRCDAREQQRSGKTPFEFRPLSTRYGIWQVPVAAVISGRNKWLSNDAGQAVRLIRDCIASPRFLHVVLDVQAAAEQSLDLVVAARRLLKTVDSWRSRGQITVETLTAAAAPELRSAGGPQKSVLRSAA